MTDIPKDLIGGARKVVFEWRKKQAEPGVFPFLHAMIAEFVQTEIERVRIERDNLKVSIKSIQDGHTLAVELLAECERVRAEEEIKRAKSVEIHEAWLSEMTQERDENRELASARLKEFEEVKKFAKYADTEWKDLEKHLKAELEEEKKYSDELKEDRDKYRELCVIHLDALEEERKHADWLEEALSRIHGTESDHRGIDKSKCFLCIALAAHKESRK